MASAIATLTVVSFLSAFSRVKATFHCQRTGSICYNRGFCDVDGFCVCQPPFTGDQCLNKEPTRPDQSTQCDAEHYGLACELKRYDVQCFREFMIFNINPLQFRGRVVTLADINGPSTSACVIPPWSTADQNKPSGWEGFGTLHRYTGNGASDCIGNPYKVMDGDYEVYRLTLVVEYEPTEPAAVYAIDEAVEFECRVNRQIDADVVTSGKVDLVTQSGSTKVMGEMAAHVVYSVEYAAGGEVPRKSRIPVGTPLRLTFSLKNESQYTKLGISVCRALPDLSGQSEKWIDLVDDRCFYPPTAQGYVMSTNKDAASVYFKAVRILPSVQLHLRCYLYACTQQEEDKCDMRNIDKRKCPPRQLLLRRKRGISKPDAMAAGFNYTLITTHILLDDTSDVSVNSVADNSRGTVLQKTHLSEVLVWGIVSAACISLVVLLVTLAICLRSMLSAGRYKTANCNSTVA